MTFTDFTIDGEVFRAREIVMNEGTPEAFTTFVGDTSLSERIMLGDDYEENCRGVDEQIIFFVTPEELRTLSDKELINLINNEFGTRP